MASATGDVREGDTMKRSAVIYLAMVTVSVIQGVWYYPKLPEAVASRFGASGAPDGWMSRGMFVGILIGMTVFVAALLTAVQWAMLLLPASLVNLPNKAYWYAPERQADTRASLSRFMLQFGVATMLLVIVVMQMALQANLSPEPRLSSAFWFVFVAYLLFIVVWVIRLFVRFGRLPSDPADLQGGKSDADDLRRGF
jgi:uncharacterized membrane protein